MKNKLNLILTIVGAILSSNTNAQTFYQCVPNACPSGQYFDGANCKSLPATYTHPVCADGQYYNGQSCKSFPTVSRCTGGYVWDDSRSACFKPSCSINFEAINVKSYDSSVSYSIGKSTNSHCRNYKYSATMKHGDCITYNKNNVAMTSSSSSCGSSEHTYCCYEQ